MNTNPTEVEESEEESKNGGSKKTYPIRTLKDSIAFVAKVYDTLGGTQYHSNIDIAGVAGLAVASIKQPLSTYQQYGLIELKHKVGYKTTDLFKAIYFPVNDKENQEALLQALKAPAMFGELFSEYLGQSVPLQNGLANQIVRNYGLKPHQAEKTAEIFLDNLKYLNLLNERNVLLTVGNKKNTPDNNGEKLNENNTPKDESSGSGNGIGDEETPPSVKMINIPIPLKSTKTKALLSLPEDYTEADLDRIAKFVDALK